MCFVFLVVHWGLNEIHTVISSENSQLLQSYTVTYGKKLEKVVFVKEESLRKRINNKDVYVVYGAKGDIPEKAVSSRRFDSIEAGETLSSYYYYVRQHLIFDSFILFSPWF